MPPPSVLDTARKSGTTPSCSNAKVAPTRPNAVCASSRIRSMPRRAQLLQAREIAGRRHDHPAGAEDRLGDRGGLAGAGRRSARSRPRGTTDRTRRNSAGSGSGRRSARGSPCSRAAPGRSRAARPSRSRAGAAGQAVERRREADHLVAAARQLGHADRRLVGLAAGVEQDHLLQLRRQQRQARGTARPPRAPGPS